MPRLSLVVLVGFLCCASPVSATPAGAPVSPATQECLDCHSAVHPGIVADWKNSRHAVVSPHMAMQVQGLGRKLSSKQVPDTLRTTAVGCAECHSLRPEAHADTFEHNGHQIHMVVSPDDCVVCHVAERTEYADNIMSAAHGNLADNALYNELERSILGKSRREGGKIQFDPPDPMTQAESCYYCHGTRLSLAGTEQRDTDMGELEFPIIKGWPNQGVGRINLDGSQGACSSCHTRHHFSIEMARKPHTCKECHAGPDVPAYKVYSASKHGNIFSSKQSQWRFDPVPWTIGRDFSAPTCAACHISLVVDSNGEVISHRSHRMSDRLGMRIFGLVYAHAQPLSPDTTRIRNAAGMPLPTDLDGTPAARFLIDADEIKSRRATMQRTCLACHGTSWTRTHFERLDNTIATTDQQVRTATQLMQRIWQKKWAHGPDRGGSPFDEYIERRWSDAWLLYANNTRFVSAMGGGGDYGVFEDGRYHLSKTIMEMQDWLQMREAR